MLLTLAATVMLVSVALTIFVQRAVYRPIKALVGAMQRAQAGSLDVEVVPHGRDELSTACHALQPYAGADSARHGREREAAVTDPAIQ